jgi:hypothetical protein
MSDPYRLCEAGVSLRTEVNARWPGRDKSSDGWIGDAAHATRTSDHNPWVKKAPPANMGIVRAIDIDVDGVDMAWLMEHLRCMGAAGDPRLAGGGYLIFNERITNPDFKAWRRYTGSNKHTKHGHVSFTTNLDGFDLVRPWGVANFSVATPPPAPFPPSNGSAAGLPTLKYGDRNSSVAALQRFLNAYNWRPALPLLPVTGNYLAQTKSVIAAAQAQMGVTGPDADGSIVGPRTNAALWARGYRG